jgi:regulator of protease activity HflC (stomatin/prohibitin superfamily)
VSGAGRAAAPGVARAPAGRIFIGMSGFGEAGWLVVLAAAAVVALLWKWVKVVKEYERGVVFRLGHVLERPKGPGLVIVPWPIDRMVRVSLRTVVDDIPSQDVITRDNVSIKVNAVVYFRVVDATAAIVRVEKYLYATSQLAQTTLRSVLGMVELDELLAERDKINLKLQAIIDRQTGPWGIKVSMVEVKQVDLPQDMQGAIARQAVAEREKRAKTIHAEGEYVAADRLAQAAAIMQQQPGTMQLRYLQSLIELASDRTSTIVFPIPIDLLEPLLRARRMERTADELEEDGRDVADVSTH